MHEESFLPAAPRRLPRGVAVAISLFFIVATALQFLVLLDFGPDEPFHVDYAYSVAVEHRLPSPRLIKSDQPGVPDTPENHLVQHPVPYYAVMGMLWLASGATQRPLSMDRGITSFDKFEPRAIFARRMMRMTSALFGCLALFLIARTLLLLDVPDPWIIFLIAWAAAWPMLQYVCAVVNNESAAYAYSAWLCFLLIKKWPLWNSAITRS